MSKTNSKTSSKPTSPKATKGNGKAPAAKAAPVTTAAPKAEEKATKGNGIANGGETKCNEAVGLHFSIAKAEKLMPEVGDLVMAQVGKHEIPLVVRVSQPKVNGDHFVQAFLVEKGSGHHQILGEAKDSMVKVFWY